MVEKYVSDYDHILRGADKISLVKTLFSLANTIVGDWIVTRPTKFRTRLL
jgi:predicted small secreted protein